MDTKPRFNPEFQPDPVEIANLASIFYTPGFAVVHKIFMSELDKLLIDLSSVDNSNKDMVLARHAKMHAAGQFYQACVERLNVYVSLHTSIGLADNGPADPTEILDMGETYDPNQEEPTIDDLPSFFGEAELVEDGFEESPF